LAMAGQVPEVEGDEVPMNDEGSSEDVPAKSTPKKPNFRSKGAKEKGKPVSIPERGKARREVSRSPRFGQSST
jgi:hypothetical protein